LGQGMRYILTGITLWGNRHCYGKFYMLMIVEADKKIKPGTVLSAGSSIAGLQTDRDGTSNFVDLVGVCGLPPFFLVLSRF
jgi:hypothetical protein